MGLWSWITGKNKKKKQAEPERVKPTYVAPQNRRSSMVVRSGPPVIVEDDGPDLVDTIIAVETAEVVGNLISDVAEAAVDAIGSLFDDD